MSINVVTSSNTTAVVSDVQIGNSATSQIGLYATTPVSQAAAITVPTDLATSIVAITAIIAALKGIGVTL